MSTTKDKLKLSIGITVIVLIVTVVTAVIFMDHLKDNPLVAHILGIVEGAFLSMINFYWGTSKSSEDKTKMLEKKNRDERIN